MVGKQRERNDPEGKEGVADKTEGWGVQTAVDTALSSSRYIMCLLSFYLLQPQPPRQQSQFLSAVKAYSQHSINVRGKEGGMKRETEGGKEERGRCLWNPCYLGRIAKLSPPFRCLSKQLAELRQFCLKIISQGISIPFHT